MSMLPKEVIRELIREKKFESADDILETLKGMFREVLQETLEAELDEKLGYDKYDVETKMLNSSENSRNGYSKKTLKTQLGNVEIDIPRDRNGEYEPQIIPKHKRNVTGIEEKVLALYAAGMTTRDIHAQIRDLYDVEISAEMVSKITDRVLPLMQEWQNRPL
ncbi:MAG TPA: IS256 family transposase, partial [Clostridiales bacterium]|nr:IS256 family transposase [Clostridiales bacterium]